MGGMMLADALQHNPGEGNRGDDGEQHSPTPPPGIVLPVLAPIPSLASALSPSPP